MSLGDPFLLGVNYWPRRKAMYWWADLDAGEVREEFALIRDLGLRYVRIFLLWESFQASPDSPEKAVTLPVAADMYYQDPMAYQPLLYERFGRLG
ncbi:MAG TPA: hypothetical protein VGI81_02310 [Tepidisphaeraceae bacterium]|jgi:endo-1,4-beta-mannosidase